MILKILFLFFKHLQFLISVGSNITVGYETQSFSVLEISTVAREEGGANNPGQLNGQDHEKHKSPLKLLLFSELL